MGYSGRDATLSILKNNIYGLEIDDRAYQLAYFAVMMKARSYIRKILNKSILPQLCPIQESNRISDGLIDFVADRDLVLLKELKYLKAIFINAKEYGSILDVEPINFVSIFDRLTEIKNSRYSDFKSIKYQKEAINLFCSILKQAVILSKKYDVVVTNPPYMGTKGMNKNSVAYLKKNFSDSKNDLFAVFIEKCQSMTADNQFCAMITQQSFMFLTKYEKLRGKILEKNLVNMIHLGARSFEEIGGGKLYKPPHL